MQCAVSLTWQTDMYGKYKPSQQTMTPYCTYCDRCFNGWQNMRKIWDLSTMNKIFKADIWHGNIIYRGFWLLLAVKYSKITAHWVTSVTKQMILKWRLLALTKWRGWAIYCILSPNHSFLIHYLIKQSFYYSIFC